MEINAMDFQNIDVGARLRELRTERGLSMRSLSRLSGLSTNALSMIERSLTSPSVSTLYKIADALGVPITAFFRQEPARKQIVFCKASERRRIPVPRGLWEGLGGESFAEGVEPLMITLERGANSGHFSMLHSGHEFVLCLEGELHYEVEEERFTLLPGDSLLFSARLEHRWRNANTSTTRALIVLSGFVKGESPTEYHLTSGKTAPET
jgi:quercetin dioxygenase-like cupin family protein/DNA-binding XRE family transcriptional regulator